MRTFSKVVKCLPICPVFIISVLSFMVKRVFLMFSMWFEYPKFFSDGECSVFYLFYRYTLMETIGISFGKCRLCVT